MKRLLMMRGAVVCGLLVGLFLLTGLSGCGYKNMPVAPQALVPEPISDLRYEVTKQGGAVLHWSYPTRTVNGEDITEIDSFLLYRAEVPTESYCDTCPIPFGKPVKVEGGSIPEREGRKSGRYEIGSLRPAYQYFFKIQSRTGWLTPSADSNQVSFTWETPPVRPNGFLAEMYDNRVVLRWQPVADYIDGTPIKKPVTYQISRSVDGGSFENVGDPLISPKYVDREVGGGREYAYRAQALTEYNQEMVAGDFTKVIKVRVLDQTAPASPENVKAVRTEAVVKVFWDPGTEEDLAGYRVYRRVGVEIAPELVGVVKVPYSIYEDFDAPEKDVYVYYAVTSFDKNDPPNESKRSAETDVR